jgi:hypothetical protein
MEIYSDLLESYQNNLNDVNELIDEIIDSKKYFENNNKEDIIQTLDECLIILNLRGFLIFSNFDTVLLIKFLKDNSIPNSQKIYFSKKSYLLIYEVLNTFNSLNKKLKNYCSKNNELLIDYRELNNKINVFKLEFQFETKIKTIRNIISGHFNKSFKLHYSLYKELDIDNTIIMISKFIRLSIEIHNLIIKIESIQIDEIHKINNNNN